MVVINRTKEDIKIRELKRIVPADGKKYILPADVAFKYKSLLIPVQMSDSMYDPKTKETPRMKISNNKTTKLSQGEMQAAKDKAIDLYYNKGIKVYAEIGRLIPNVSLQTLKKAIKSAGESKKDSISNTIKEKVEKTLNYKIENYTEEDAQLVIDTFIDGVLSTSADIAEALGFSPEFVEKTLFTYNKNK